MDSEGAMSLRLPDEMRDIRFVVIDESVGGRSAFELQTILKATEESPALYTGVLLRRSPHLDSSILAAWCAGFDLCLVGDGLDMAEFRDLCGKLLSRIVPGSGSEPAAGPPAASEAGASLQHQNRGIVGKLAARPIGCRGKKSMCKLSSRRV